MPTTDHTTPGTAEPAAPTSWEEGLIADIRAHGGRPSRGPLAGHPILLMWSTGARSGTERRAVLTYSRDGQDLVVAGSASGSATDPAWISNVRKQPLVRLEVAGETYDATATVEAIGPERDRLWRAHVAALPWFGDYEQKTTRVIPVVRLRRNAG
jgi:deazaflavin-dependent oxidoreductase (nitroreductase family)